VTKALPAVAESDGWLTVSGMATTLGTTPEHIGRTLVSMGLSESKVNSRGEGWGREYSPGIVALVKRELLSRGHQVGGAETAPREGTG
jgi:hypothetical protein